MGSKDWLAWSDPTDKLQLLKLLKKCMLILIERCQNTQCIAVFVLASKRDQHNIRQVVIVLWLIWI